MHIFYSERYILILWWCHLKAGDGGGCGVADDSDELISHCKVQALADSELTANFLSRRTRFIFGRRQAILRGY